jgi:sulfate transport system substrate-binding protein
LAIFYDEYNKWFIEWWKCTTGQNIVIEQVYGASGDLMRDIVEGSSHPDVISMSNPYEMDVIADKTGIVDVSWRNDFPNESSPYYSAVVFLVRKGNPKQIKDWEDLLQKDIIIGVSNPKTCGGGRWVYIGALGFSMEESYPQYENTGDFLKKFYSNVPVLYADQGIAGKVFVTDHIGDVLVTYEAFSLRAIKMDKFVEMITPTSTVSIEMSVAVATKNTDKKNITKLAQAYVTRLYDPAAQKFIARTFIRPRIAIGEELMSSFPKIPFYHRDDVFEKNNSTEKEHLENGGIFDLLMKNS